jgi:hypothetical protein
MIFVFVGVLSSNKKCFRDKIVHLKNSKQSHYCRNCLPEIDPRYDIPISLRDKQCDGGWGWGEGSESGFTEGGGVFGLW